MKGLREIKQGKNPTAQQKKYLSSTLKLNPKEWLVVTWTDQSATLQRKSDGLIKTVEFN